MALPDGVEMAERCFREMKDFLDSGRKLTIPDFYISPLPRKQKGWFETTWEQVSERAIVEGSAPVFIAWDLGVEHKPVRLPTADDLAVHRAIGVGHGDEKRMGCAQYNGSATAKESD